MSRADRVFFENCREILEHGVWDTEQEVRPRWADGASAHTVKRFGIVNRYDLAEEFPILTIRRTFWKSALDELLWIWQKKSNNVNELRTRLGRLGRRLGLHRQAYGYQLGREAPLSGGRLRPGGPGALRSEAQPASRRILTNLYNFADLSEMHLYPCAYSMTFNVSGDTLNAILNQRSQDMLTANNWNVCQYALLVHMFAQVSGLKAGELVHVIADAHIYDRHIPIVEEILKKSAVRRAEALHQPGRHGFLCVYKDDFSVKEYYYTELGTEIPLRFRKGRSHAADCCCNATGASALREGSGAHSRGPPALSEHDAWEDRPHGTQDAGDNAGRRAPPGRRNLVMTRSRDLTVPGAEVLHSVEEALRLAETVRRTTFFVIAARTSTGPFCRTARMPQ